MNLLIFTSIVAAALALSLLLILSRYLGLYIQALVTGADISPLDLVAMRLRRIEPREIVITRIRLHKAGINVPLSALETHVLAGGSPADVATAMIMAARAGKLLRWEEAAAIDLGGEDVLQFTGELCGEEVP